MAEPYFTDGSRLTLWHGRADDVASNLEPESVQTIVTSPPYFGLRDYGVDGQIGGEETPEDYIDALVNVFESLAPALRKDGTIWLNLGDSYANDSKWGGATGGKHADGLHGATEVGRRRQKTGYPAKSLMLMPFMVAIALRNLGWIIRSENVWSKPNAMPEPVTDRTTRSHESIFMLAKSPKYYYDADAIAEDAVSEHASGNGFKRPERVSLGGRGQDAPWSDIGGKRNARDVWTIPTQAFPGAHFAVFPPEIPRRCILAGSHPGDLVLDPFSGSGTTGMVALAEGRRYAGIDISSDYLDLSLRERFTEQPLDMGAIA
jgi:DNA modification methylase